MELLLELRVLSVGKLNHIWSHWAGPNLLLAATRRLVAPLVQESN